MPQDLQIAPEPERSIMPAILIAGLVLVTVAVVVFLVNPRETASLTVEKADIFAPHMNFKSLPGSLSVLGDVSPTEDDLYVVTRVKATDKLRLPLFLNNATMSITTADGSTTVATAISPRYYVRLETIFPQLAPLLGQPIMDGDQIDPGETREGCFLVLFPGMKAADWQNRKAAVLSLNLRNQSPQTVTIPKS
jgi:hypothetical protein